MNDCGRFTPQQRLARLVAQLILARDEVKRIEDAIKKVRAEGATLENLPLDGENIVILGIQTTSPRLEVEE